MESWSRSSSGNIRLTSLLGNSSLPAYVLRNSDVIEETVTSIALDWVTEKLYVGIETTSIHNSGRIEVCSLDGSVKCAVVLYSSFSNAKSRVDAFHSLVLDPVDGLVKSLIMHYLDFIILSFILSFLLT